MYKLNQQKSGEQYIVRISDGAVIPLDQANIDYQEYLKWLEEGNTPLPPDTPETSE